MCLRLTRYRALRSREVTKEQLVLGLTKTGLITVREIINNSSNRSNPHPHCLTFAGVRKLAAKLVCELACRHQAVQKLVCELYEFTCFKGKVVGEPESVGSDQ